LTQPRLLSAEELADLPDGGWLNATVDTTKYYQNVWECYEVDSYSFDILMRSGHIGQAYKGRYYVALHLLGYHGDGESDPIVD